MKNLLYKNARLFALLWATVIFILCATPGQYIPSADWLELLSFDKLVHASMFFILTAFLFLVALKYRQSKTIIMLYWIAAVLYGASLEVMQAKCFSNRSADWKDMFANTFGCVVALLLLKKLRAAFSNAS